MTTLRDETKILKANRDEIRSAIHIIWQRGWKASVNSVSEMLAKHMSLCPLSASPQEIEEEIALLLPTKEEFLLRSCNPDSPFNKAHPRPWPTDGFEHQEAE